MVPVPENNDVFTLKGQGRVNPYEYLKSSGAIALSLLQALAMFGCLEKREAVGLTLYCILTFIAVVATIGFFASLISIGRTIHIQSEGHNVAEFLISCVFYPVVIGILLSALATLQSI